MEMDFQTLAGHTLNCMRLMVEGALVLYESNASVCYPQMLAEGRIEEALALDMLGTTLTELRQSISDLQAAFVKSNKCYR